MNRILLVLLCACPFFSMAQRDWAKLRKKSYETFAYRIPADSAEKYIQQDSIPVDIFLLQKPAFVFRTDSLVTETLPKGHFVLLSITDNKIEAELLGITDLVIYPLLNEQVHIVEVRNKQGAFIDDAKVWVNGKLAKYDRDAMNYHLQQKKLPDEPLIKVYAAGDTSFLSFDYQKPRYSVAKQKWQWFKRKKLGKVITWIPRKISSLLHGKKNYRYKSNNIGANGYVVFNQPKYKLTDTVKLKAYIVDKKWKQYKENVNVYLMYYARGQYKQQLLTTLQPHTPGSFIYAFPLSDTLVNDISYTIEFKTTQSNKRVLTSSFLVEDYLLDEVAHYSFRSEKDEYYKGDSMVFYASAKDANNLPLLDAKAKLILLNNGVDRYEQDSIYIADTLYTEEKTMLTQGDTKFVVPGSLFPSANQHVHALLQFRNSNNEIQYEEIDVNWALYNSQLRARIVADTVYATYYKNGTETEADGELDIDGENNVKQHMKVHFPFKIKVDALAEDYYFYIQEKGKPAVSTFIDIADRYEVAFSRISVHDTAGFILNNPYKVPVSYLVLDGSKIIATGKSNNATITWLNKIKNRNKLYTLKYSYVWKGKPYEKSESIGLLYKILNIHIQANSQVFPGQKDSITIDVKDYKGRPVANVNMVAASYNSQFKNDIHVPEPPYLVKYKQHQLWRRGFYKMEDANLYFKSKYLLGNHQQWRQQFGMDSLLYYQMLFPEKQLLDIATYNTTFMPQLSVHVVQKGKPQPIYLLYLNKQLVYYEGTTAKMADSYQANNYYTQLGIRLLDRYIELDSVYVQPNYKHDIVLDLDNLPAATKIFNRPTFYEAAEQSIIENSIWQLDNRFGNLYVWQDWRVATVGNSTYAYAPHLVGPFKSYDSLHFFSPRNFDSHFRFEPGYIYNLSNKILRLEKNAIFKPLSNNAQYNLPVKKEYSWTTLGDTLKAPPVIEYPQPVYQPYLEYTAFRDYNEYMSQMAGKGKLEFMVPSDTALHYVVLLPIDTNTKALVLQPGTRKIMNIQPGTYRLLLVNYRWQTAALTVAIRKDTTLYIKTNHCIYSFNNSSVDSLLAAINAKKTVTVQPKEQQPVVTNEKPLPVVANGNGVIRGVVKDDKGANPIPNASIVIKGSRTGVTSNVHGQFVLSVKPGTYTLLIASLGYTAKELKVEATEEQDRLYTVLLSPANQSLDEVVVTGYGVSKRKEMTASVSIVSAKELTTVTLLDSTLAGKVAGLSIVNANGQPGADVKIVLRGVSAAVGNKPLYIIDGIVYDEMPKNITPEMMGSIEILKDASATAIYGSRAADGVVVITTKTKTLRTQFRDYAFWQPEFFTDKNGRASFTVTYPDNITSWQTYVLGMDKKRRMGKAITFTKAFKPVMAQLSTPQFLIEGDHVQFIGKAVNYTNDSYTIKTSFTLQDKLMEEHDIPIAGSASAIAPLTVIADAGRDTLKARFQLQTTTGFNDGEERKVPLFKKGTEEATGQFWMLDHDTTISFKADKQAIAIEIVAQNNTLNVLLDEIDHLKKYPYYCMEQTASKLRGLVLEKKIRETLNEPFTNEKEMNQLLGKLQNAQHFDGSWSWWETGRADLYITNYILNALLPLRGNALVETNVRNGLLYLQNQLPYLRKGPLLATLSTLSAANHAINYTDYLTAIVFDSLSLHEQWQYVQIKQHLKIDYASELDSLLKRAVPGMLGGLHWGEENYRWYSNANATTVVAYDVLRNNETQKHLTNNIIQYFLEQRSHGYWRNTVESANILATILPDVLQRNKAFQQPAQLSISGDTAFAVSTFPFKKTIGSNNQLLHVQKTGGGITYLTMYQKIWNARPAAVTNNFEIKTYFEKTGNLLQYIKSGERMKMIVTVDVKKEADYVMLEIPIPAGCTYAAKKQDNWGMHKEFLKNKVLLFADQLSKGIHSFEIELEPRYNGKFTLNPAKAELMYFPTFFGRNEMREVEIKEQ